MMQKKNGQVTLDSQSSGTEYSLVAAVKYTQTDIYKYKHTHNEIHGLYHGQAPK